MPKAFDTDKEGQVWIRTRHHGRVKLGSAAEVMLAIREIINDFHAIETGRDPEERPALMYGYMWGYILDAKPGQGMAMIDYLQALLQRSAETITEQGRWWEK